MSNLNILWCNLRVFPLILLLVLLEQSPTPPLAVQTFPSSIPHSGCDISLLILLPLFQHLLTTTSRAELPTTHRKEEGILTEGLHQSFQPVSHWEILQSSLSPEWSHLSEYHPSADRDDEPSFSLGGEFAISKYLNEQSLLGEPNLFIPPCVIRQRHFSSSDSVFTTRLPPHLPNCIWC